MEQLYTYSKYKLTDVINRIQNRESEELKKAQQGKS